MVPTTRVIQIQKGTHNFPNTEPKRGWNYSYITNFSNCRWFFGQGDWAGLQMDKLAKILPKNFGIVFDGWSGPFNRHYVAIFAVYPRSDKQTLYRMLATQPLLNPGVQRHLYLGHGISLACLFHLLAFSVFWACQPACLACLDCLGNLKTSTGWSVPESIPTIGHNLSMTSPLLRASAALVLSTLTLAKNKDLG